MPRDPRSSLGQGVPQEPAMRKSNGTYTTGSGLGPLSCDWLSRTVDSGLAFFGER